MAPNGRWVLVPRFDGTSDVEYLVDVATNRVTALDARSNYLWSGDGELLCGTGPAAHGATEVFTLDPKNLQTRHVTTLVGGSTINFYGLTGCEPSSDRIVVSTFGFGSPFLPTMAAEVVDLAGTVLRRFDYSAQAGQLFLSVAPDCSRLAENWLSPGRPTVIRRADSGQTIAELPGRHVASFSFDGALMVADTLAAATTTAAVDIETRTGRVLWRSTGKLSGSTAGPSADELAVEVQTATGSQTLMVVPGTRVITLPSGTTLHLGNG